MSINSCRMKGRECMHIRPSYNYGFTVNRRSPGGTQNSFACHPSQFILSRPPGRIDSSRSRTGWLKRIRTKVPTDFVYFINPQCSTKLYFRSSAKAPLRLSDRPTDCGLHQFLKATATKGRSGSHREVRMHMSYTASPHYTV